MMWQVKSSSTTNHKDGCQSTSQNMFILYLVFISISNELSIIIYLFQKQFAQLLTVSVRRKGDEIHLQKKKMIFVPHYQKIPCIFKIKQINSDLKPYHINFECFKRIILYIPTAHLKAKLTKWKLFQLCIYKIKIK